MFDRLRQPSHPFVPSTETFPLLDLQRVADELELERLGKTRGTTGEPASTSTVFDPVEVRVVQYVERTRDEAESQFRDMLHIYRDRLAELNFDTLLGSIRSAAGFGVGGILSETEKGKDRLTAARRTMVEADRALAAFRRDHGLQERTAHYPRTGGMRLFQWAFLGFLLVIESIANGAFFAEGSTTGFLGGALTAGAFAAVNIGLAFVAGRFLATLLPRRESGLRWTGRIGLVAYLALAVVLNLLIAHYRSAFAIDPEHPGSVAIRTFTGQPVSALDVTSMTMFGMGLLFAGFSAFDAWRLGDSYLGYGAVSRSFEEARDMYGDERSNLIDSLKEIFEGTLLKINELVDDFSRRRAESQSIHSAIGRVLRSFDAHLGSLERTGNGLLSIYREANRQARSDEVPKHFAQIWQMTRPASLNLDELRYADDEVAGILLAAKTELAEHTARIDIAYREAMDILRSLDSLDPDNAAPQ